jgi:hypothetical protein
VAYLVGIGEESQSLISRLYVGDDSNKMLNMVSIVGFGGLSKTALAKTVFDKIEKEFQCAAFAPAGREPNIKNVQQRSEKNARQRLLGDNLQDNQTFAVRHLSVCTANPFAVR